MRQSSPRCRGYTASSTQLGASRRNRCNTLRSQIELSPGRYHRPLSRRTRPVRAEYPRRGGRRNQNLGIKRLNLSFRSTWLCRTQTQHPRAWYADCCTDLGVERLCSCGWTHIVIQSCRCSYRGNSADRRGGLLVRWSSAICKRVLLYTVLVRIGMLFQGSS